MNSVKAPTEPLSFLDEVIQATPGTSRLEMCIQCGTCGGSCPSGADMDHTPRGIFALIRADLRDEVLRSNTPWYCVSCYFCAVRCPQEVHITDIMYTLKNKAIKAGLYEDNTAASLAQTFVDQVERNGRSFEFGLATRHNLKHRPLGIARMAAGLGMGLLTKGRMDLTATRIQGIEQLHRILERARELEGA